MGARSAALRARALLDEPMTPAPSLLVTVGIPTLAILVALGVVGGVYRASPPHERLRSVGPTAVVASAWLGASALLATSGLLSRFDARPPPMLLILVPTLGLPLLAGLTRVGERMARELPVWALIAFHGFRLPLELVMHAAASEGTMPQQMTFTGWNFDIFTGASAIVVAACAARYLLPRWVLLAWNAIGTFLLAAIVSIAVASLPLFHAFGTEPHQLNTWVAYFPFVWLPAGLVASALLGHVVLWRKLSA